jgi:adenylosuccinate synthase
VKQATVFVDLGAGDSGKGSCVDAEVRRINADLVVRFGGGPQCSHAVITDSGITHLFAQFGSGTLAGARTFLSKHMLIDPAALFNEASKLELRGVQNPYSMLIIDRECLIITPWHKLANRLRERARGVNRHGSVGSGVGEARGDALMGHTLLVRDIERGFGEQKLYEVRDRKLEEIRPLRSADPMIYAQMEALRPSAVLDDYRILAMFDRDSWPSVHPRFERVVMEGHQGVLLDEAHGFAPYNTWTDCTFNNANTLLEEAGCEDVQRIGVLRTYATRHGNGPLPTEASLDVDEPHNGTHPWMGPFRVGHFDAVLANYALDCCGRKLDGIALTHMDRIPSGKIALGSSTRPFQRSLPLYGEFDKEPAAFAKTISEKLGVDILIQSFGPKASDKMFATACRTA